MPKTPLKFPCYDHNKHTSTTCIFLFCVIEKPKQIKMWLNQTRNFLCFLDKKGKFCVWVDICFCIQLTVPEDLGELFKVRIGFHGDEEKLWFEDQNQAPSWFVEQVSTVYLQYCGLNQYCSWTGSIKLSLVFISCVISLFPKDPFSRTYLYPWMTAEVCKLKSHFVMDLF